MAKKSAPAKAPVTTGKPSSLLDTRVIYCGDCLMGRARSLSGGAAAANDQPSGVAARSRSQLVGADHQAVDRAGDSPRGGRGARAESVRMCLTQGARLVAATVEQIDNPRDVDRLAKKR